MRVSDPAHPRPEPDGGDGRQLELDLGIPGRLDGSDEGGRHGRTPYKQRLGAVGEERAVAWYLARGYTLLARNWRCRDGEIDLVVTGHGLVVFCEVKTRTSERYGLPAEAVTPAKQQRLRGLAVRFLQESPQPATGLRFDVASVRSGRVSVIEAAF
jgi:putative endonuclease